MRAFMLFARNKKKACVSGQPGKQTENAMPSLVALASDFLSFLSPCLLQTPVDKQVRKTYHTTCGNANTGDAVSDF